jgi:hypothetical protein
MMTVFVRFLLLYLVLLLITLHLGNTILFNIYVTITDGLVTVIYVAITDGLVTVIYVTITDGLVTIFQIRLQTLIKLVGQAKYPSI